MRTRMCVCVCVTEGVYMTGVCMHVCIRVCLQVCMQADRQTDRKRETAYSSADNSRQIYIRRADTKSRQQTNIYILTRQKGADRRRRLVCEQTQRW